LSACASQRQKPIELSQEAPSSDFNIHNDDSLRYDGIYRPSTQKKSKKRINMSIHRSQASL
jgi:hypothetical protein